MMRLIVFVFAAATFGSGLKSAWLWHRASQVKITPGWNLEIQGDHEKNIMGWMTGTWIAMNDSAKLNKAAAKWTALSVFLGAISSFVRLVANPH